MGAPPSSGAFVSGADARGARPRICRIGSDFKTPAHEDIYVPCLDLRGSKRLFKTVERRMHFVKAIERHDLQAIKGVGPFIEEKLNALGIYTYLQISKMKGDLEDHVNEAIEFFPGRVKRDEWVNQAKDMLNEEE